MVYVAVLDPKATVYIFYVVSCPLKPINNTSLVHFINE